MLKKLIASLGKTTAEISIAFKYGYNSVESTDVIAKIQNTDIESSECAEPYHDHNDGCPAQEECPA